MSIKSKPVSGSPENSRKRKGLGGDMPPGPMTNGGYPPYPSHYGQPPSHPYGYPQHQQHFSQNANPNWQNNHAPPPPPMTQSHSNGYGSNQSWSQPQQQMYGQLESSHPNNSTSPDRWGQPQPPHDGGPYNHNVPHNQTPSHSTSNQSGPTPNGNSHGAGWHPQQPPPPHQQPWQNPSHPPPPHQAVGPSPSYGQAPHNMWNQSSPSSNSADWSGNNGPPPHGRSSPPDVRMSNHGIQTGPPPPSQPPMMMDGPAPPPGGALCLPVSREDTMSRVGSHINRGKDDEKEKGRGSYRCGKCGVPKKGHICPYQPKLKRRPDEQPPEMRNASTQVEMDEFLVLRRLNLEIQGFPETYMAEPIDNVGTEVHNLHMQPMHHGTPNGAPPMGGMNGQRPQGMMHGMIGGPIGSMPMDHGGLGPGSSPSSGPMQGMSPHPGDGMNGGGMNMSLGPSSNNSSGSVKQQQNEHANAFRAEPVSSAAVGADL